MPGPSANLIDRATRAYRGGSLGEAQVLCKQVLKGNKRNVTALQMLGTIAVRRGAFDEALGYYHRCAELRPQEAHYHYLVGKAQAISGRLDEAMASFQRALRVEPGYAHAVSWLAAVLERVGDYERARAMLAPLVEAAAEDADMATVFAKIELHDGHPEAAIENAGRHLGRADLAPYARQNLSFICGRAYEALGDYDRAFAAFAEGNRIGAPHFDVRRHVAYVDRVIEAFSQARLAALPRGPDRSQIPVIIAGMPRSGTTLVEQIIDAHPQGHGAGELTDLVLLPASLPAALGSAEPFPQCIASLTAEVAERLARPYLQRLKRLGDGAARVVNKNLQNSWQLGLIWLLWPGARVIHCRRHPMDTCLSCYINQLLPGSHPYASDLGHLGLVYRQYERLMAHWRAVLDWPMLEVSYEAMVADPEPQIRRIIDFCGLAWDERCLSFHESGRQVITLSYDQVRRPIYQSAVARYEKYRAHLGPLKEALGGRDEQET